MSYFFIRMVRVNLISPRKLSDQHLIAEYNEILMLIGYVRKHSSLKEVPAKYCLGKGHVKFFKNKLKYLGKRHELLKREMGRRGFQKNKTLEWEGFGYSYLGDWKPQVGDFRIIKKRLRDKIKMKPDFYRYYGLKKSQNFFCSLLK